MGALRKQRRRATVAKCAWFTVQFSYGGYTECECGFRPGSQAEMDAHIIPTDSGSGVDS
jgi:hypothetical protein